MSIQAVLFDADGVLIFPWRFSEYLTREHGLTREITSEFYLGVFEECLQGEADLKDVLPPFLSRWGWSDSLERFLELWFAIEHAVDSRLVSNIQSLRRSGLVCCLATNQEKHRSEYMRNHMGFSDLFDHLFFSYALAAKKPDALFYRKVEDALGLEGDQILFWDDSPSHVVAAKARGWHAELYSTFADLEGKLPLYLAMTR